MGIVGCCVPLTGLRFLSTNISAITAVRSTAAPPIAIPAMAPGLSVALDVSVDELLGEDVGSVLGEEVEENSEDIVVGMKGVGVAVEDPCDDETPAATPFAERLT